MLIIAHNAIIMKIFKVILINLKPDIYNNIAYIFMKIFSTYRIITGNRAYRVKHIALTGIIATYKYKCVVDICKFKIFYGFEILNMKISYSHACVPISSISP